MLPHHLTFSTSRDALCPTCNAPIITGAWTIRLGLAICLACDQTVTDLSFMQLWKKIQMYGGEFFSLDHSILFFTPPAYFSKQVVWYWWVGSPAHMPSIETP